MQKIDLEVRDIAWYKAKAKEINELMYEAFPLKLRVRMAFMEFEKLSRDSKYLPKFPIGGIIPSNPEVILVRSEGKKRDYRIIKTPVPKEVRAQNKTNI